MKFWHKFLAVGVIGAVMVGSVATSNAQQKREQQQNAAMVQQAANQQATDQVQSSTGSGPVNVNNTLTPGVGQRLVIFVNDWNQTIWVEAITSFGGPLPATHWVLPQGASVSISVPDHWDGRFWGDTDCSVDATGQPTGCATGHCPPGTSCEGGAASFATLAEFNMQYPGANDIYDVSLVDGYNLPIYINTIGGSTPDVLSAHGCLSAPVVPGGTTCTTDANVLCANSQYSDLQVTDASGNVIACKSACTELEAEGNTPDDVAADPYCCPGGTAHGTTQTCQPDTWPPELGSNKIFKQAEPFAYSYTFDDGTSTLSCAGSCGYQITFGVSG